MSNKIYVFSDSHYNTGAKIIYKTQGKECKKQSNEQKAQRGQKDQTKETITHTNRSGPKTYKNTSQTKDSQMLRFSPQEVQKFAIIKYGGRQ